MAIATKKKPNPLPFFWRHLGGREEEKCNRSFIRF
jgi:hypothetical protein